MSRSRRSLSTSKHEHEGIPEVRALYYITHIDNLDSILTRGILCHSTVDAECIPFTPVYDAAIVSNRKGIITPAGRSLWDYANVYFQPRNPMLYRVVNECGVKALAIIGISPRVMDGPGVFVASGNAAHSDSTILPAQAGLPALRRSWKVICGDWWNRDDGSKRIIMAETLVPTRIGPEHVLTIYVSDHRMADAVRAKFAAVPVVPEPNMFFQPLSAIRISSRLSLVDGDMFFSGMQTLTISVNITGVMGKGLASRAKYQFPDVYVAYQDACRGKAIRVGTPYLYKRDAYVEHDLADEPASLTKLNGRKWFLLFPTKRNWRDNSRLEDIEAGLEWLLSYHAEHGIQSLATPALGCGLGKLDWGDVGPLMCRYLDRLPFNSAIYLPRERALPPEQLTAEFLLPRGSGAR